MRANEDQKIEQETAATEQTKQVEREPYVAPVIEKFPPMSNVTFGTNIQPTNATVLFGA